MSSGIHNNFEMKKYNCIVVCGPTACGKTSLAVRIAEHFSGEILSADSRQVYCGMDIGTGKDLCEYRINGKDIAYHLIDIAEPEDVYTLYRYLADFNRAFNECLVRGVLPVIAGGTGLYIEAALKQYAVPHAPENAQLREELTAFDKEILIRRLEDLSPEIFARTDLSSVKRIVRSIEIALVGDDAGTVQREELLEKIKPLVISIAPPREELHIRIARRLDERFALGMCNEIQRLIDRGVPRERLLMFGMEYKYIALHQLGDISYDEMRQQLLLSIRRLAKRQMTWFRGMQRRGIDCNVIESADFNCAEMLIRNALNKPV